MILYIHLFIYYIYLYNIYNNLYNFYIKFSENQDLNPVKGNVPSTDGWYVQPFVIYPQGIRLTKSKIQKPNKEIKSYVNRLT